MKLTAITGPKGELVAIVRAHLSEHDANPVYRGNAPHATLTPAPGQIFHEMTAPAGHENLSREDLRRWVVKNIPRKKTKVGSRTKTKANKKARKSR